jgi:hypothetical protein
MLPYPVHFFVLVMLSVLLAACAPGSGCEHLCGP